jgi:hypothetical protein
MENKTHQGASAHTARKEFEIEGLTTMRMNQFKCKYFNYKRVILADVFSGSGRNTIDGTEVVEGSPIRLIRGFLNAQQTKALPFTVNFWFSDIRQQACDMLKKRISDTFNVTMPTNQMEAKDAINCLGNYVSKNSDTFLFLIVDPNGPKDFPRDEIVDIISGYSKRVDVIPYISATAINRCIGARNKAGRQFESYLSEIENFNSGFVYSLVKGNRKGWIRMVIPGDRWKWTMIPSFGQLIPRNNWQKQGYVEIDSEAGSSAIKNYCGGQK